MINALEAIATRWISRRSAPDPAALAAIEGRLPAVVITGGSRGIGLELARAFAPRADAIGLIARSEATLASAAESLRSEARAARIETLVLDVTEPDAPDLLDRWLKENNLYCDVLVNNAAIGLSGPFSAADAKKLDQLLATNVVAVARLTRAVLPAMLARGRGGILTIASLGGVIPGPHQAAYYASKAFVLSLSEAVASENAGLGVRIAAVLPGPVETRFHADMGAEGALYREVFQAAAPRRVATLAVRNFRLGRRVIAPDTVPSLALFLLRLLPHTMTVPIVRWLLDTGRPAVSDSEETARF